MEKYVIDKDQIVNSSNTQTGKDLIDFMILNLPAKVTIVVFKQESGLSTKIPTQLNTYSGHKIIGIFDDKTLKFNASSIEEENIQEIMSHQNEKQWK